MNYVLANNEERRQHFLPGGAHNLDIKRTDFVMTSSGQDGNKVVIYLHFLTNW